MAMQTFYILLLLGMIGELYLHHSLSTGFRSGAQPLPWPILFSIELGFSGK